MSALVIRLVVAFASAIVLCTPKTALASELTGTAGKFVDGDTFWICGDGACTKIRLCGVNAPELDEKGGAEAKAVLASLVGTKAVTCIPVGQGTVCDGRSKPTSYDRVVAQCFSNGQDLSAAMVESGHACDWVEFSGGVYSRRGESICRR